MNNDIQKGRIQSFFLINQLTLFNILLQNLDKKIF